MVVAALAAAAIAVRERHLRSLKQTLPVSVQGQRHQRRQSRSDMVQNPPPVPLSIGPRPPPPHRLASFLDELRCRWGRAAIVSGGQEHRVATYHV